MSLKRIAGKNNWIEKHMHNRLIPTSGQNFGALIAQKHIYNYVIGHFKNQAWM